jgi:N-acetylglucosaminyl-diphospho-decaprenol L-rhamnosyltransferase
LITFIVVTFESAAVVGRCLDALAPYIGDAAEVIVVDNASEDDTAKVLQGYRPAVRVIVNERNEGFGAAVNRAAGHSRGEILVVMNPDVVVRSLDPSALARACEDVSVGALALAHGRADGRRLIYQMSPYPRWWSGVFRSSWGLVQPRWMHRGPSLARPRPDAGLSLWTSGGFFAIPTRVWQSVGGFDPGFVLFYEDIDLCRRVAQLGCHVVACDAAVGVHRVGTSSSGDRSLDRLTWEVVSWLRYVRKWVGPSRACLAAHLLKWNLTLVRACLALLPPTPGWNALRDRKRCETGRLHALVSAALAARPGEPAAQRDWPQLDAAVAALRTDD